MSKFKRQIIKERLNNYPWNYYRLSDHIPLYIMLDNLDKPWSISLHMHTDLTWNNIKKFSNVGTELYSKHNCITFDIIKNNPDYPWHWTSISSSNKNITWQIILNNLDYPWNWDALIRFKPITWDIIKEYREIFNKKLNWSVLGVIDIELFKNMPDLNYDYGYLSCNKNLTWDIILNNIEKPWSWYGLSINPCITFDIVVNNLDLPWDWESLSLNPNITWKIILNNIDYPWHWYNISEKKAVSWDDIKDNYDLFMSKINLSLFTYFNLKVDLEVVENLPDLYWNWYALSNISNITKILVNNWNKSWNWDILSKNIPWSIIRDNPDKPWNWNILSTNSSITWNIVQDNLDKPWNRPMLSTNSNITFDIVFNNRDYFDGLWSNLSSNRNLTAKIIQDNPDKYWNYSELSHNLSITFDIVKNNLDKPWDWDILSWNENMFDIDTSKEEREYMAVFKIQQYWLKAYYNPDYLICKRRLLREFKNLISN
jgi:hypothetical protein